MKKWTGPFVAPICLFFSSLAFSSWALGAASPSGVQGSPWLSTDPTRRLVIEIDSASSCQPTRWAVDGAVAQLKTWMPGREIIIVPTQTIPEDRWPKSWSETQSVILAQDFLDNVPNEKQEVLYIQWVPSSPGQDRAGQIVDVNLVRREGEFFLVPMFVLFCDLFPPNRPPGGFSAKVEKLTLLHETGHLLRLVDNPQKKNTRDFYHCKNDSCLMAGVESSILRYLAIRFLHRFLPGELCADCQEELQSKERERLSWEGSPEKKAQRQKAQRSESNRIAARILVNRGQIQEGISLLENSVGVDPEDLGQRRLLAAFYLRFGQSEKGRREANAIALISSKTKQSCHENSILVDSLLQKGFYRAGLMVQESCPGDLFEFQGSTPSVVWAKLGQGQVEEAVRFQAEYAEGVILPDGYKKEAWELAALISSRTSNNLRTKMYLEKNSFYLYPDSYWVKARLLRREDPSGRKADRVLEKQIKWLSKLREGPGLSPQGIVGEALLLIERGDNQAALKALRLVSNKDCQTVYASRCRRLLTLAFGRLGDEKARDFWLRLLAGDQPTSFDSDVCLDLELRSAIPEPVFRAFFPRCWVEEELERRGEESTRSTMIRKWSE